ncbi:BatA domain-containing protein [Verrucomicrobiota bacterium]
MTFLQPALLWGLPAVLLPVLIHLLNRLRYRSVKWAAMIFLISATRSSIKRAQLRHYLILLFRTLAVLLLILALSRPLIGGWLGMTLAGAPDTVIILLDRSASMEATNPQWQVSKRAYALSLFAQSAKKTGMSSRFVLIENALLTPQEIAGPHALEGLSLTSATDTAADMPAMFRTALDYIIRNRTGRTEIWIASDLQKSNWRPESPEWENLSAQISALPQDIGIRLLALHGNYNRNFSVAFNDLKRLNVSGHDQLNLALDINCIAPLPELFPAVFSINGSRSQVDLSITSQSLRYNKKFNINAEKARRGWGKVEIPADENPVDNVCYFVYGDDVPLHSVVVSHSVQVGRCLKLALAPLPGILNRSCKIVSSDNMGEVDWQNLALLVWQGPDPDEKTSKVIRTFAEGGGTVICFPPDKSFDAGLNNNDEFFGVKWEEIETAHTKKPFRISMWEENHGPLAKTQNGLNLPVAKLFFLQRRNIMTDPNPGMNSEPANQVWQELAVFSDNKPFLLKQNIGKGHLFICASLPRKDWSNLETGSVLVPMIQRIFQSGGMRLMKAKSAVCGEWQPPEEQKIWTSVDSGDHKDFRWQAGVYQSGTERIVLNRPAIEDVPDIIDKDRAVRLMGEIPVQVVEKISQEDPGKLQSEIWSVFIYFALAFMMAESGLLLSEKIRRGKTP